MTSDTPHHDLHAAYLRLKGIQSTPVVAEAIGISVPTLRRFERQGLVSWHAKHAIAEWVRATDGRPSLAEQMAALRRAIAPEQGEARDQSRQQDHGISM